MKSQTSWIMRLHGGLMIARLVGEVPQDAQSAVDCLEDGDCDGARRHASKLRGHWLLFTGEVNAACEACEKDLSEKAFQVIKVIEVKGKRKR